MVGFTINLIGEIHHLCEMGGTHLPVALFFFFFFLSFFLTKEILHILALPPNITVYFHIFFRHSTCSVYKSHDTLLIMETHIKLQNMYISAYVWGKSLKLIKDKLFLLIKWWVKNKSSNPIKK